MTITQLDNIIKNSKNILLVSHINPDGDTLGSMCGMYSLITENYKKKCDMVAVSKIPQNYLFIPYVEKVQYIDKFDLSREYDLVINLDVASLDRCSEAQTLFEKSKFTVNIDHHGTNNAYADLNIIDANASATGEVLFDICQNLGWKISVKTAICLYTAIMTDTGSFRFSNTTPKTMKIAGELLSFKIDSADIYQKSYESQSKDMVLFQAYCVNKAHFCQEDKIAYTIVYKKDLEKYNYNGEDFTDGLTEKLRAVRTTEVAFVLKELSVNSTKLSMRSKSIDVAKICAVFGGGGHKLAAGAVIKSNMNTALDSVLKEIKNCL